MLKSNLKIYTHLLFIPFLCVCVSGRDIPQVSKVPYLDPWQWNSPLCIFHQGKFNTLSIREPIHISHTVCNISQSPQQERKTKIWNVLNRFNIVQVRYQCGGKREAEREGREKWAREIVIYGQCCFLAFHLSSMKERKAQAHINTKSSFYLTQKYRVSFSAICDQLYNVLFIMYDVNCWILTPVGASSSSLLSLSGWFQKPGSHKW